jgi:hypothetical protein
MLVVVVTANHYWLDGAAAALLLAVAVPVAAGIEQLRARHLGRFVYRPVVSPTALPGAVTVEEVVEVGQDA